MMKNNQFIRNFFSFIFCITSCDVFASPVSVPDGGTGLTTMTAYGLLLGGTTSIAPVQQIGTGTSGQILLSQGAGFNPTFGNLTVASGGTGQTNFTQYGVLIGNGTSGLNTVVQTATAGVPLVSAVGANPTFAAVSVPGGGTGRTTFTNTNQLVLSGTIVTGALQGITGGTSGLPLVSTGAATAPTFSLLSVSGGGTGVASVAANAVVIGATSGTAGPLTTVSGTGSAGQGLMSSGSSAPTWQNVFPGYKSSPASTFLYAGSTATPGATPSNTVIISPSISAGMLSTATENTALGYQALRSLGSGARNVAVGSNALAFGSASTVDSVALGSYALFQGGGSLSVAIGSQALYGSAGTGHVAIGYQAGLSLSGTTLYSNNTIIGNQALKSANTSSNNVALGALAGSSTTTGSGNIYIGYNCQAISGGESNTTVIGTPSTAQCFLRGIYSVNSSDTNSFLVTIDNTGKLGNLGMTTDSGIPLLTQGGTNKPAFTSLGIAGGGTGQTSLTQYGVLVGNVTQGIASTNVGTTGTVLAGVTSQNPTFTTTPSVTSISIANLPAVATDGVNKYYADLIAAGFAFRESCVAATLGDLSLITAGSVTYANGSMGGVGATLTNTPTHSVFTIDGVTPTLNQRVLIKNQTTQFQNGIYKITQLGAADPSGNSWILTRTTDFDQGTTYAPGPGPANILPGVLVPVTGGTQTSTVWLQTNIVTVTGTSSIAFSQFLGQGTTVLLGNSGTASGASVTVSGGSNITTSGDNASILTVNVSGTTEHAVQVGSSTNALKSLGLGTTGQALIAASNADPAFGTVPVFGGGTGLTTMTAAGRLAYSTNATTLTSLAIGSAGQVLTVAGGLPTWAAASGSGSGNFPGYATETNFLYGGSPSILGYAPTNTTIISTTAPASITNSATDNTAVGKSALNSIVAGTNNVAVGGSALVLANDAGYNTAVGVSSLAANVSGTGNAAVGASALLGVTGSNNTALGYNAGSTATTGSNNIYIGANATYGSLATESNTTVLGNSSTTSTYIFGINSGSASDGSLVMSSSGTNQLAALAASATSGIPLVSAGAGVSPTFSTAIVAGGGTGATTLTNHGVLLGQATGAIVATTAGTSGQILLGSTNADPAFITPTQGTGLSLTANATTLQYGLTIPVAVSSGGTGLTSLTQYSLLVGSGAGTPSMIAQPATVGIPLVSAASGNNPTYSTAVVAGGGTGAVTFTSNGVLLGNGTDPIFATAAGTTGTVLVGNTGAAPTFTATPSVTSITISEAPSLATDGANKAYVDSIASGIHIQTAVVAATTGSNLSAAYDNGTSGVLATLTNNGAQAAFTIDSVPSGSLSGQRVLIKDQTDTTQNGIYTVTTVGTISTNWVLTRVGATAPLVLAQVVQGSLVPITSGTINASTSWLQTELVSTVGTDSILFAKFFSQSSTVLTGNSGTASGSTVSVAGGANINTTGLGTNLTVAVSGTTPNAVQIGSSANALESIGLGSSGQALVSGGSLAPAFGTLPVVGGGTGIANFTQYNMLVGNGTGTPTLLAPAATSGIPVVSAAGASPTYSTATVPGGGTGLTTLTKYGIMTAGDTATANMQQVSLVGTTGQALLSQGTDSIPAFGTLTVAAGGTGQTSLTARGILFGNGVSAVGVTAQGTAGRPLLSGGSSANPSFSTLTASGGGTGRTTLQLGGVLLGNGTSNVSYASATLVGISNASVYGNPLVMNTYSSFPFFGFVSVYGGGTGTTFLTPTGLVVGRGGSPVTSVVGSTGTVLAGFTSQNPTFTATPSVSSMSISTTIPVSPNDAATKYYADLISAGFVIKAACVAATTVPLPTTGIITYTNSGSPVGSTATLTNSANAALVIDGYSPVATNRVLIKDQTSAFQNGVYTVTNAGSAGSQWQLTRATDFNLVTGSTPYASGAIIPGDLVPVSNGTTNVSTTWLQTNTIAAVGTTSIAFSKFLGQGSTILQGNNGGNATGTTVTVAGGANIYTTGSGANLTIAVSETTNHAVQVGNAAHSLTSLGLGTQGQPLLAGDASTDPAFGTLTVSGGGTGLTTMTAAGSILYATSSTEVAALGIGTTGQVLTVSGGLPAWAAGGSGSGFPGYAAGTNFAYAGSATTLAQNPDNTMIVTSTAPGSLSASALRNTALGSTALNAINAGTDCTAVGFSSLAANSAGTQNVAVGSNALLLATGSNNVALGHNAGSTVTTGSNNIYIGRAAVPILVTESNNTVIGNSSTATAYVFGINGSTMSNGSVVVNNSAGKLGVVTGGTSGLPLVSTGSATSPTYSTLTVSGGGTGVASLTQYAVLLGNAASNVAFAVPSTAGQALLSTGGGSNPAFGNILPGYVNSTFAYAGSVTTLTNFPAGTTIISTTAPTGSLATATQNVGLGDSVCKVLTSGNNNVAVGYQALTSGTTCTENVVVGSQAGLLLTSGSFNTALGRSALAAATTANNNVAQGYQAILSGTTCTENVAIGSQAGLSLTTGSFNAAVGRSALAANATGANNVAVGYQALNSYTGSSSTAVGYKALSASTSGSNNTASGYQAAVALTTGSNNVAEGYQALLSATTCSESVAIGAQAGLSLTTGSYNTAVGRLALSSAVSCTENVAVGYGALLSTTGSKNTVLGFNAGSTATTGSNNIFIGNRVVPAVGVTDANTIVIGNSSNTAGTYIFGINDVNGSTMTTGSLVINNSAGRLGIVTGGTSGLPLVSAGAATAPTYATLTVSGGGTGVATLTQYAVLLGNVTGNVAFAAPSTAGQALISTGASSNPAFSDILPGYVNSTFAYAGSVTTLTNAPAGTTIISTTAPTGPLGAGATENVGLGDSVFKALTSGRDNVAVGYQALTSGTTCTENVAVGSQAGLLLTTGSLNTAVGRSALATATTARNNVAVGYQSLNAGTTCTENVAIGSQAGLLFSTGSFNTALGRSALAADATGANNVAVGYQALTNYTGSSSTAVGYKALTTATSSSGNSAFGYQAGVSLSTGNNNTALGYNALSSAVVSTECVAVGYGALSSTTGGRNTALGYNAGSGATTGSNNIYIGNAASVISAGESNTTVIGNSSTAGTYIHGINDVSTISGGSVVVSNSTEQLGILTNGATGQALLSTGVSSSPSFGNIFSGYINSTFAYAGSVTTLANAPASTTIISTTAPVGPLGSGATGNVGLGNNVFNLMTASQNNVAIGPNALSNITTNATNSNIAVGANTLRYLTTGTSNLAVGANALQGVSAGSPITGDQNVVVGNSNLIDATSAENNTAIGWHALFTGTTCTENVAVGSQAGLLITTGSFNTAVGRLALSTIATGANNTAVGFSALNNYTGSSSTAVGYKALYNSTSGSGNTAVGYNALTTGSTCSENVAIGSQAGLSLSSGSFNTAVGFNALSSAQTVSNSTALGYKALATSTGNSNTAVGYNSATALTTGTGNTAIGGSALLNNTQGLNNTAVGSFALSTSTSSNNTAMGYHCLEKVTTGTGLVSFGYQAGNSLTTGTNNTIVGFNALFNVVTGSSNVAIGYEALNGYTGSNSTAVGFSALNVSTSGSENTAVGYQAADALTTGSRNTAFGHNALGAAIATTESVAIGYGALLVSTGDKNTALGYNAGSTATTGSNNIYIGNAAAAISAGESNNIVIGNGTSATAYLFGVYNVAGTNNIVYVNSAGKLTAPTSSRRYKKDIITVSEDVAQKMMLLDIVTFKYINDETNEIQYGVVAEDVINVFPELILYNQQGQIDSVQYMKLLPLLIKKVQMQDQSITALQATIAALINRVSALENRA
jgi:trimeric autotransporter adhesin